MGGAGATVQEGQGTAGLVTRHRYRPGPVSPNKAQSVLWRTEVRTEPDMGVSQGTNGGTLG